MKKVFSLLLCLIMTTTSFSISASASDASESAVQPRFTYIATTTVSCSKTDDGRVIFSASLDSNPHYVDEVKITMYLMRRPEGTSNSWTVFGVYTSSDHYSTEIEVQKDYSTTYEYRTFAQFTAYGSDGGTETTSNYSRIVP